MTDPTLPTDSEDVAIPKSLQWLTRIMPRVGSSRGFLLFGLGGGLFAGVYCLAFELWMRGTELRDVSIPTFLLLYPMIGLAIGWRNASLPKAVSWRGPADFSSEGTKSTEIETEIQRRWRTSVYQGFGVGLAVALLNIAFDFLWRGLPFLTANVIQSVWFYPVMGCLIGFFQGLRRGDPKPWLFRPRFRLADMLVVVGYLALLMGLGSEAERISKTARIYYTKEGYSRSISKRMEGLIEQNRKELESSARAETLRSGRIPAGLDASQTTFLESLNAPGTDPSYRKQRFNLIAESEERTAQLARQNIDAYKALYDYHKALEAKYARAKNHPSIPIEPDPPGP